mmetsp:Transcript_16408/g.31115  ORF Transcript_16408/g.31115 Transcript_16408/m.31115 type:complete len:207 (-) Transcript_16408:944-1564(-)
MTQLTTCEHLEMNGDRSRPISEKPPRGGVLDDLPQTVEDGGDGVGRERAVRQAMLLAERLHVGLDVAEVRAGDLWEEVVLDVDVEADVRPVEVRGRRDVVGGVALPADEVLAGGLAQVPLVAVVVHHQLQVQDPLGDECGVPEFEAVPHAREAEREGVAEVEVDREPQQLHRPPAVAPADGQHADAPEEEYQGHEYPVLVRDQLPH